MPACIVTLLPLGPCRLVTPSAPSCAASIRPASTPDVPPSVMAPALPVSEMAPALIVKPRSIVRSLPAVAVRVLPPRFSVFAPVVPEAKNRSCAALSVMFAARAASSVGLTHDTVPLLTTTLDPGDRTGVADDGIASETYKSEGSISRAPVLPSGADASTNPVSDRTPPDSSTKPPSPPWGPPFVSTAPAIVVRSVDSTVNRPPFPFAVALAAIVAPAATVTVLAVFCPVTDGPPFARFSVVPMATTPPPAGPEALTRAVEANRTAPVVFTTTEPPVVLGA